MTKLDVLKNARNIKIGQRNQFFRKKWFIEDKISEINKDKLSYQYKNEYSALRQANLNEKSLKAELNNLNLQISKINEELTKLNSQIEDEEIFEFNSMFLSDNNLHKRKHQLFDDSRDLSKKYESAIEDYSKFLKTLNSYLKNINDDSYHDYLNQLKIKLETEKEKLIYSKKQCIEFERLDELKYNLVDAINFLKNSESDFICSKSIIKDFNILINDFNDFSNKFYLERRNSDNKFVYPVLDKIRRDLQNKIAYLSDYKKQCLKSNRLDDLYESIGTSKKDFIKMKNDFSHSLYKSKNLSAKFDGFTEYYWNSLRSFNSKLEEVEETFWYDDFELMKSEIKTKFDSLLHFQNLCVENNRLDDFEEAITNTRKDLIKIRLDFNQSIAKSKNLSDKFYSTVDDYYAFIFKSNSDLKEINDEFLVDVFNQMIEGAKIKVDDLLDYRDIYKYERLDDLDKEIDIANNDLVKIKDNFSKVINRKLNELMSEAKAIFNDKSTIYSTLNLRLSDLIDKTDKLNEFVDRQELSDNLNEIKSTLDYEFENLNNIESELLVIQNSLDIKVINDQTDNVNNLINQLNDLNLENCKNSIDEEEKTYNELANLNKMVDSETVENLLNDLNKCFKMPMFMRQIKRYNLNDDELNTIKNDIKLDIINHVIGDDANLRNIIKIRCGEFKRSHIEIDDKEINDLLSNINVDDAEDEIIDECKNKVKQDYIKGNISINNVELKFNYYLSKKINESEQLKELEYIKNNPDVPDIKVHLTQEEADEIYIITEKEIISENGLRGSVERRVYYWANKKIKKNQSEARGRLNVIKRDLSNSTQLNRKEQNDFIHEIEFLINDNKIKYYDISEEYIVDLSQDFINYGQIRLR